MNHLTRRAVALALAAAVLALGTVARADAISGAPACPPGSRGESAHAGEWCVPWGCTTTGECGPSAECKPWRVCTRISDVVPGGLRPAPVPAVATELVVGTCDPSRACRGDEEPPPPLVGTLRPGAPACRDATHCVPAALPELPPRREGASIDTPPATSGASSPRGTSTETPGAAATGHGCGCTTPASSRTLGSVVGIAIAIVLLALARRRRR